MNMNKTNYLKKKFTTEDIANICNLGTQIIFSNNWLEIFNNSIVNNKAEINIVNLNKDNFTNTVSTLEYSSLSPLQKFLQDALSGTTVKSKKNINSSIINASQLSSFERDKLKSPFLLSYSFFAIQYGSRGGVKKITVSCKVVTEINPDDNTALQFSFMVNEFIKVDNQMGVKDSKGKPFKGVLEIWHLARVYKFSKQFQLSVINYNSTLFPTDGYLVDFDNVKTRADVAGLFETMIDAGQFEFISTVEDSNGKRRITQCYDPSIFLLFKLLEHCQLEEHIVAKPKYKPIEFNTVMQCIIDAADTATKLGIPLIDGMLLHSLMMAAKAQLNPHKPNNIPTPNIAKLPKITTKVSDTDNPKKK